jgi:hypothetical protein
MDNEGNRTDITTLIGATVKSIHRSGNYIVITFTNGEAIQCSQGSLFDGGGDYHNLDAVKSS